MGIKKRAIHYDTLICSRFFLLFFLGGYSRLMSYPMKFAVNPVSFPWNSSPFVNKKFTEQTVTIVTLNLEMQKRYVYIYIYHLSNRYLTHASTFRGYMGCCKSFSSKLRAPPPAPGPAKIPGPGRFTTGRPPGLDSNLSWFLPTQTSMYHPPEIQQKSTI